MNYFKLELDNIRSNRIQSFYKMVKLYNQRRLSNLVDWVYVDGFSRTKLKQAKRNIQELKPTTTAYYLLETILDIYDKGGVLYLGEDRLRCEKKYFDSSFIRNAIEINEVRESDIVEHEKKYEELPF